MARSYRQVQTVQPRGPKCRDGGETVTAFESFFTANRPARAPRWLTVATRALILALVLEVAFGLLAAAPVRAQVMATAKPSVTVYGGGEATVPPR